MADIVEQACQRHESFAAPQSYTTTKTRLVRPAQNPVIAAAQCVCPERGFALIERDIASRDRRHRTFPLPDRVNAGKPVPQLRLIGPVLGPARSNPVWVSVTQSSTVSTV